MVSLLILFTGNGDYYCSGNDLSNFNTLPGEIEEKVKSGGILLR